MIEDENESGNLVEVRRSRAPSLILPSPTHPALLPPHSRSLGSSRPASSPSTRPRQLPAVQASLPLTEQAKCRDFWHVLAARDEPAAPVVVVCCCITLCLSLCGSLWWCGVCRRGRSEWRSECAVTFHRVCMVWGHVYYDSKHSDSPGHVSTKQGHLWRKQLVYILKRRISVVPRCPADTFETTTENSLISTHLEMPPPCHRARSQPASHPKKACYGWGFPWNSTRASMKSTPEG